MTSGVNSPEVRGSDLAPIPPQVEVVFSYFGRVVSAIWNVPGAVKDFLEDLGVFEDSLELEEQ